MRYEIRNGTVQYGADVILNRVNFEIRDTEKIAVIGRNGCGKTTLIKLIAGELTLENADSDEESGIFMAGEQKIGILRQISFENPDATVEEEICLVFAPIFQCEQRMAQLEAQMKKDAGRSVMGEYAALQARMEAMGGYTYRQDLETVFQKFGFALTDLKRPIGEFSGGQQTKIAFVKLLLSQPDIMLLDEPTNHLDMPTIEWLEEYLKSYPHAVVVVSHDRMFLDHVIDVTYEIEYHRMKRYPGNYSAYMEKKDQDFQKQEKDYEAQQAEIKRLSDWVEKWKNTPTKVTTARSKLKAIEHMVKIEKPVRFDTRGFQAQFTPNRTSYTDVLTVRKLDIGYDKVLSQVNFTLHKGERIAVIGENGKGKSTLLKTIVGEIPPLGGSYTIGTDVDWGYFDQQAALDHGRDQKKRVIDDFWDEYPTMTETQVRNALGCFLFTNDEVFKELRQLSGGEKVRLALCKLFKQHPNFLILDEPTNHMDIVGKEALETMLKSYGGTVLFVSHDRYFVKQIATGILEFLEDQVTYDACDYQQYLEEKDKREAKSQTTAPAGKQEIKKDKDPVLTDVFDKKTYYNPGKVISRLKTQIAKYEKLLEESEENLNRLKLDQVNPEYATNYHKLTELAEAISAEEANQESLLERLMEQETELDEMENPGNE